MTRKYFGILLLLTAALVLLAGGGGCAVNEGGQWAWGGPQENRARGAGGLEIGKEVSPRYLRHTVRRKGETLTLISQWYTGTVRNWRAIAEANPSLQVRKMQLGEIVRIPRRLLRREETMPAEFGITGQGKEPLAGGSREKEASKPPLDLFGPVDSQEYSDGSGLPSSPLLREL